MVENLMRSSSAISATTCSATPFCKWRKDPATAAALVLKEQVDVALMRRVIADGYAKDIKDDELITMGKDPFLIAYALAEQTRVVVTSVRSRPGAKRHNRHIPDVCGTLGVKCITPFQLNNDLDFKTNWKA